MLQCGNFSGEQNVGELRTRGQKPTIRGLIGIDANQKSCTGVVQISPGPHLNEKEEATEAVNPFFS